MSMLEKVNLLDAANATKGLYVYDAVGKLNGGVVSVVRVEDRTLDFHVHEHSDELFLLLEGSFTVETDDGQITLAPGEMVIVPKGMRHRPVVTSLVKVMQIELEGTLNKQNSGALYEA